MQSRMTQRQRSSLRSIILSSRSVTQRATFSISSLRSSARTSSFSRHSLWITRLIFLRLQRESRQDRIRLSVLSFISTLGRCVTHIPSLMTRSTSVSVSRLRMLPRLQVTRKLTTPMRISSPLWSTVCPRQAVSATVSTVL